MNLCDEEIINNIICKIYLCVFSSGVAHGDEVGYLFYSNAFKNLPEPGSSGEKMTNVMTKMWTNFAKDRSVIFENTCHILNIFYIC